jgi:hypothetical protein
MHQRLWLLAGIGALALVAAPVAAQASVGVGVQAGPVRLAGAAHPGGTYSLPAVYVVNTGTQAESVGIRIERLSRGTGRTVPASWIRVTALSSRLGHGQSARIPLDLVVPASARPGQYFSDVVVTGSAALTAGGANLGVAAATDLEFRVAAGAASRPWFSMPAWVLAAAGGILVLGAASVAAGRSGIRIRIERERGPASTGIANGGGHEA